MRALSFLLIVLAFIYLLGNRSVPLWDRDEPRYAQTSKQMAESGDWVLPRILDEPRLQKPVFIYWCQAVSMKVFGPTEWAARFPSVIAALLTVLILWISIRAHIGASRAIWTVFIFSTSALTIMAAKMSITDAVLSLFITISQLCLYRIWMNRASWGVIVILGVAMGLATLTKGPVVWGVMMTTLIVLLGMRVWDKYRATRTNQYKGFSAIANDKLPFHAGEKSSPFISIALKILVVIALISIIVAPWVIAMEKRIPNYLWNTINSQVIDRVKSAQEGHKGPPGYYLLTVWGTFFPWSLLLPAGLVQAWKNRRLPAVRFALAAIIGPWIMFELVATKLPHYVLPTFPFLAFLTADMLIRAKRKQHPDITSDQFVKLVRVWGILMVILGGSLWIFVPMFPPASWRSILSLLLCTIIAAEYGRQVYLYFRARKVLDAAIVMGAGWLILFSLIYGGFLPSASFLQISPRIATILKREMKPTDRALMIDYKEMSLAFYQGGTIRPERRNDYLQVEDPVLWPNYLVLSGDVWKKTPEAIRTQWLMLEKIHGLSYADSGRIMDVIVLRRKVD